MRTAPISAAVFDCDGILVDSEAPWLNLITAVLTERNLTASSATEFRGLTSQNSAVLIAALSGEDAETLRAEIDRRYTESLDAITTPIQAAADFLSKLNIPVGVASNGRHEDVVKLLESTGLADKIQTVTTIEDVRFGKPHPDLYQQACRSLGVEPSNAVAFEDSGVGSKAAKAAGCFVFGVNEDQSVELTSDQRISSFRDLDYDPESHTIVYDEEKK